MIWTQTAWPHYACNGTLHNTATVSRGSNYGRSAGRIIKTMVLVKNSGYPLDIPGAENGLREVMCSPLWGAEWMWETRERPQQPQWDHVEPKRSHFLKETGVLSRLQIPPISGVAVHRLMHLILIRCGKWEFLCRMVNLYNQNHVSACGGTELRMRHASGLALTLCSAAPLWIYSVMIVTV